MLNQRHPALYPVLFVLSVTILFGCNKTSNQTTAATSAKNIMVTIYPYYLMTVQIVQDKLAVDLFIPANSSPHTFAPVPADIIKLEQAGLVIANGLYLEEAMAARLDAIKERVLIAASCLPPNTLLSGTEHKEQADPHIWLDPQNLILIAGAIKDRVIPLLPGERHFFESNWRMLTDSLKQMENEIQAERAHYKAPAIVTFHNSFGYFLRRFSIELAAVVEEFPGKEPTIKELMDIGDKVKGVKALFIEPQLNPKAAQIIAREFGLQIDTLDPMGFGLKARNIADILWKNWNAMKKYFTVQPQL